MGRPKKNSAAAGSVSIKKIKGLEGSLDIVTESDGLWDLLLKRLARVSRTYGFSRFEPPVLEDIHLYQNYYQGNQGALNAVVPVQAGQAQAAMIPEFLPSVLRAYYQNKVFDQAALSKWSFSGQTVKCDGAKKIRSDYEFGFEAFGSFTHLTEAQVIGCVWDFLKSLGVKDLTLEINHLGGQECQETFQDTLKDYLAGKKYDLCDNCNEHLSGRVLNVFRCNSLDCQAVAAEAPAILDFLDPDSRKHFTNILEALDELEIPYQLNSLYAGPQGFSRTNVVIKCRHKGENLVLGEGGYHDSIIQSLCGKSHHCFGFSGSLYRIYEVLAAAKVTVAREQRNDVFLVPLGELASKKSLKLFRDLTFEKISVYDHFGQSGVKNQLKQALTFQAPIALIMGQKEAMDEMVILRDVKSGMQEIISYDKIVEEVKKRLGK